MMKKAIKYIISLLVLVLSLAIVIYWLNPNGIYQLTDNTAQFVPLQSVPKNTLSLKAKDCGICHNEIYQEWQSSLHSKAYTDPFFTAYIKKDKGDPTCLVCHTPLLNQSPVILSTASGHYNDLEVDKNEHFDASLQQEGVTCAACHVRNGVIYGPYKKEQINAPHPVVYDKKFLSKSLCKQCHEVPSKDFSLMNEGVCSTGMESDSGIWAARGYICQDCHMPGVERPLVPGYPKRLGKKHLWPGAYSNHQLQKAFSFRAQQNKNSLTITISNSGAGHKVPTGDTDRFIVMDFFWQETGSNNQIEKKIYSIEFKRQVVWQPIMFVLSDNRLAPGESKKIDIELPSLSSSPSRTGKLSVNAYYHVMTTHSLKRLKDKFELKNEWPIKRLFIKKQVIPIYN